MRWCPRRQAGRVAEQEEREGRSGGRGGLSGGGGSGRVLRKEMKETSWTMDEAAQGRSLFSYSYSADER